MKFPAFEPIDLKSALNTIAVEELYLSHIHPNPNQPRKNFIATALNELADSIKEHGVIQPIIVQKRSDNQYEIVAGERRWRASKLAGCLVIPAIVQENKTEKNVAISLIENIQREQLNPIELAQTFQQLNEDHNMSHEAIAMMIGKSRATVTNLLRLLNLTNEVQTFLITGKLEMGHARALLSLDTKQQNLCAQEIIEKKLTVRDTEKWVQFVKKPKHHKSASLYDDKIDEWVHKLSNNLSSKVSININDKGEGKVVIHFSSPEKIDWLIEHFTDKSES